MSSPHPNHRRSVLWSFQFVGTALVGSLAMALVSVFAPPAAGGGSQDAVPGTLAEPQ